ncbi:methyl-accepting chemotaxis protein [Pseudodesulfovibrio indicus]|uniref:methyl-accepting chemotaxis protein n=1 Tax=Pseudodesulfovibrio indicus TaxID=1716143 RepID=UPI0029302237|nr:methyl-accepting chemotaxis protein [Pseudodesulfovibrio indicus]
MRLSIKILLFCLLVGIVPLAGMAGYSLRTASVSLEEQSFSKLVSLQEAKSHELEGLTDTWNRDIVMYSEAKYVYSALVRLRDIVFYASKPGVRMDVADEEYAHALRMVAPDFEPWVKVRGYADALVLDDTGRIVFSLAKGNELGEDIVKGPLSSSRLVGAWQRALKGETVFVDFHPYAPLDGLPCAFIAAPIRRHGQEIEGVAMLRIPIDSVNKVMHTRAGLGETGEAYLVGSDSLMRSDLHSDPVAHGVVASFADPRRGAMHSEAAELALKGQSGRMQGTDYRGREVLAAYSPIPVGDTAWGLVGKIDADEALDPVRRLRNAAMVVGGGSVAAIILVTLVFLRFTLLKPLDGLRQYAARVAEGDLDARPEGVFKGELGQVSEAIERMVHNLGEKMQEAEEASRLASSRAAEAEAAMVRADGERKARTDAARAQREGMLQAAGMLESVVSGMREASSTVNKESDSIMAGANSLSARVESTATSMEQLAGSIREVAENAETASRDAGHAHERAREGSEVVRRTVESIAEVHTITEALKKQVASLGARADSIGKVMNVISDIADQTNLLALNAAIEAARAGEAGRGFAVVADEVRKLAEKTMDATREVGGSISAIQSDVRENIKGMDSAAGKVEVANRLAGESGAALNEIMEFFETTSRQVEAIAAASTQQSQVGEEINRAVSEVDEVSSRTAAAVAQTGGAITELTGQIETLSKLYGLFMLLGEGTVQRQVESLAKAPDLIQGRPSQQLALLAKVVRDNPSLEMAWITDTRGIQVTEYATAHGVVPGGIGGPGANWSDRDWFREPMRTGESFISNIYYSNTIEDYCLTVATPVKDREGTILSLLAVDVRHGIPAGERA